MSARAFGAATLFGWLAFGLVVLYLDQHLPIDASAWIAWGAAAFAILAVLVAFSSVQASRRQMGVHLVVEEARVTEAGWLLTITNEGPAEAHQLRLRARANPVQETTLRVRQQRRAWSTLMESFSMRDLRSGDSLQIGFSNLVLEDNESRISVAVWDKPLGIATARVTTPGTGPGIDVLVEIGGRSPDGMLFTLAVGLQGDREVLARPSAPPLLS